MPWGMDSIRLLVEADQGEVDSVIARHRLFAAIGHVR